MSGQKKTPTEESEEPSRAAGACVLIVLACVLAAAVFAVSPTAGALMVWAVGIGVLGRAYRRMSDLPATPPPREDRPSCDECAGHDLVSVTPLAGQKGMLIYKVDLPDRPGHTHVHIARKVNTP